MSWHRAIALGFEARCPASRLRLRACDQRGKPAPRCGAAGLVVPSLSHTSCHVCRSNSSSFSTSAKAAASSLILASRDAAKQKQIQTRRFVVELGLRLADAGQQLADDIEQLAAAASRRPPVALLQRHFRLPAETYRPLDQHQVQPMWRGGKHLRFEILRVRAASS